MTRYLTALPARYRDKLDAWVVKGRALPAFTFLRELQAAPASVGAICPSSTALARRMAAQVRAETRGLVIELGAGTGSVTRELLLGGVAPERLLLVEQSPGFARHLRRRFPHLRVIQGDAAELASLLPADAVPHAIVSSLPLRSLPADQVARVVEQWRAVLPAGGLLVQFTYAVLGHPGSVFDGFALSAEHLVVANLPPAKVMVFQRAAMATAA